MALIEAAPNQHHQSTNGAYKRPTGTDGRVAQHLARPGNPQLGAIAAWLPPAKAMGSHGGLRRGCAGYRTGDRYGQAGVGLVAGWRNRLRRAGAGVAEGALAGRAAHRDRLAGRRRALGLTQEELAAVLGVERSTVVRWEAGATQPLPWLRPKLARALHVPAGQLAELLGGPAPPGPGDRRAAAAPVPRQLPAAVAGFTGRAGELAALTGMLEQAGTACRGRW